LDVAVVANRIVRNLSHQSQDFRMQAQSAGRALARPPEQAMTQKPLDAMTVNELVAEFEEVCLAQDKELRNARLSKKPDLAAFRSPPARQAFSSQLPRAPGLAAR
jgi:hypothetical protein